MILIKATVRSERNSISAVSLTDKPNACPSSAAVRTLIIFWILDVAMQHLIKSLLADRQFATWCFLPLFLKGVKHHDGLGQFDKIEHSDNRCFAPDPKFMRAGCQVRHWSAERKPQVDSFLQVAQCSSNLLSHSRFFSSDKGQGFWVENDRFHVA